MKFIEISNGELAIVDDDDYERLNKYSWNAQKNGLTTYAVCYLSGNKGKYAAMHHMVLPRRKNKETHHINHDGIDNRKCNLQNLSLRAHRQLVRPTKYRRSL